MNEDDLRVTLISSGGFAALPFRRGPRVVDAAELVPDDAARLRELVAAALAEAGEADAVPPPDAVPSDDAVPPPDAVPHSYGVPADVSSYRVTIGEGAGEPLDLRARDLPLGEARAEPVRFPSD